MRVLVTGGRGLIGTHLVELLLAAGDDVHVVSRQPTSGESGATNWQRDLTEPGAVRELVTRIEPDAVCHLAGLVNGARSLDLMLPALHANLVVTVELLDAVTRQGIGRLVTSGSLLEEPARGGADQVPGSPYGASRWASSAYSRMCHALFETPVVVLRPSYVYGPHQSDATKLVPHVIRSLLADTSPELGAGDRVLDWLYATDAARAYQAALRVPDIDGSTIDIISGFRHSVREVVDELCSLIGPPSARPRFGAMTPRRNEQDVPGDPSPAGRYLAWQAQVGIDPGLRHTVDWFREVPG